uniref:Uncharacterized protein n=1 Tax=Fagus sylvatica TaxID=28930 RepID=A0A2N9EAU1_FAGSY
MASHLWILCLSFLFLASGAMSATPRKAIDVPFGRNYVPTWAFDHIKYYNGGSEIQLTLDKSTDDEWIATKESPNEPNEEWPSVFHRDAQEEDENGDKDKEIHNLSDCELENEVRDFDDFPIDDLDGSNDIYGEGLPLEDNIHPINDNLGF